jgi:hypothetical protein
MAKIKNSKRSWSFLQLPAQSYISDPQIQAQQSRDGVNAVLCCHLWTWITKIYNYDGGFGKWSKYDLCIKHDYTWRAQSTQTRQAWPHHKVIKLLICLSHRRNSLITTSRQIKYAILWKTSGLWCQESRDMFRRFQMKRIFKVILYSYPPIIKFVLGLYFKNLIAKEYL